MRLLTTLMVVACMIAASVFGAPIERLGQEANPLPANFHALSDPAEAVAMPTRVISGNPDAVRIEFGNPPLEIGTAEFEGREYSTVRMSGEGSLLDPGAPELPRVTRLVMVGNRGQFAASLISESHHIETLSQHPLPMQRLNAENENEGLTARNEAVYAANRWYPENVVEMTEPATLRDVRFVVLVIHPVQVNPVTGEMRVYDHLEVAIENTGGTGENEIGHVPTSITPGFKKLYSRFENFRGSALDELPVVPGGQLIVCRNDATVLAQIQKLVDWRRKKGIDASYVTLNDIPMSSDTALSIRNYISSQYLASNGQLEFVTLVGDPDGTGGFDLITHYVYPYQFDNYFGAFGGGPNPDPVPDIAVGRISVRTGAELSAVVAKTIDYEANPSVADTTWFTRAWCAAHTGSVPSNPSMKRYTRHIMLQHGMHEVPFDVFPSHINTAILQTRIANGICVFNDRMSWIGEFYSSDLDGLTSNRMSPFVMVITCGTGNFASGAALSEEWVRRGSSSSPIGAIGCVGLYGTGTHVPYNNIVDAGVMYALYVLRVHEQGIAVIGGKLELYKNYWEYGHQGDVNNFSYWMNLMGDPAVPLRLSVPHSPSVTRPNRVDRGTNHVSVTVTLGGSPVANALVGLLKGTETFARGYTNAAGMIDLPINVPTTGYMKITVTDDDLIPYVDSIEVTQPAASLAFYDVTVDDDNSGGTSGNSDGIINPGETVDLSIGLQNTGTPNTVSSISGTLTSDHPGVQIVSGTRGYPSIPAGEHAAPTSPFRIQVGAVFDGEPVTLFLTTTSSAGSHVIRVDLTPAAGDVTFSSSTFLDGNSRLDPGETGNYEITISNTGSRPLSGASGILRSLDSHVIVNDSLGTYGDVAIGGNSTNTSNTFNVTASGLTVGGYGAQMQLVVTDANGFRDSVTFTQTVGVATTTTPTGPDGHGYYAYDNTETQPSGSASLYAWVEIGPPSGPGTAIGFTDGSEDADQSAARRLPFPFTFYGQTFDTITICTNGWLAFGDYTGGNLINDFRNYDMGSPNGPPNQVAAYWDDLIVTGITYGDVYTWSDEDHHRYIVEWRTETLWTHVDQVFQIILFDPASYPSPTGDGKILVQYQTLTPSANHDNSSTDNDWATVGIQNSDHSIGLNYSSWNMYPASAAPLTNGRAIMYTTDISGFLQPPLTVVSPNGGNTWYLNNQVSVMWVGGDAGDNVKIELSRNGAGGPWETIIASTPNDGSHSFTITGAASSTCRIRVSDVIVPSEYDVSDADFAISTLQLLSPNGGEIWFADSTEAVTWAGGAPSALMQIELSRNGGAGPWQTLTSSAPNTGSYAFVVARPASDQCRMRVTSLSDPGDTDES
ncbi:hypothetical protein KKH27_11265, partial [bacterium]|nr:hypothetical protein [bacterium]MBU1985030.1 hypothetical protein [bacterium]